MTNIANLLDYYIVIVMMISVLMGLARGITKEILSLVVWSTAIGLAVLYCKPASLFLKHTIPDVNIDLIIAFILIIFTVLLIGDLLTRAINQLITHGKFSITDRLIGCLFGGIRAIAIIAITLVLLKSTHLISAYKITNHPLINYFSTAANWLETKLPKDFKNLKIPNVIPEIQINLPANNSEPGSGITRDIPGDHGAATTTNAPEQLTQHPTDPPKHPTNKPEIDSPNTNAPNNKHYNPKKREE